MKISTNETYIYSLCNEDNVIRYIGKSNNYKSYKTSGGFIWKYDE